MSRSKESPHDPQYERWVKSQTFPLSSRTLNQYKNVIKKEVLELKALPIKTRFLKNKKTEVEQLVHEHHIEDLPKHLAWCRRLIWTPRGKGDFRRITPHLIRINEDYEIPSVNIWGEPSVTTYNSTEPYRHHWTILRTLVSRAPNDGCVGRQLRFLVVDKPTRKYLGVICIASSLFETPAIHNEIGWNKQVILRTKKSKMNCLANGQTIVPTQPFGRAFLGGKLLSLLCLSKEVAQAWEQETGFPLVGVHTTSLYGTEYGTQYDNLSPYWRKLPEETSGEIPIKIKQTLGKMKEWMRHTAPYQYWKHFVEKRPDGTPKMRDGNSKSMRFVYPKLGLSHDEFIAKEPRGVYSAWLYSNAKEFLRGEIDASALSSSWDNSIQSLTEFWRFGTMGDTTRPTDEIVRKEKKPDRIRKKVQMKGMTKGRIDGKKDPLSSQIEWYLDLANLSWDETQKKYLASNEGNGTPQQVQ